MADYDYSLDREAVVEFSNCSASDQRMLLDAFDRLAAHPFIEGDCMLRDAHGRDNQVLDLGGFVVSFWSDHAVRVVRITVVERVYLSRRTVAGEKAGRHTAMYSAPCGVE